MPSFTERGQIMISINNTGSAIDEDVSLNGTKINVFFEDESDVFSVSVSNASITVGNLLTLEGSFFSDVNGCQSAGTGISIFMGEGPVRFADGSLNPLARGILVEDAAVGMLSLIKARLTSMPLMLEALLN